MKKLLLSLLTLLRWAGSSWGQTTLIDPAGDGGFETGTTLADNGWIGINGANGAWYFNTSTIANGSYSFSPSGNRSIYFSNNSGTNWTYNTSAVSGCSHFYRNVTYPSGETKINLSFRWNASGESTWDILYVYLCPTTLTPVANSPSSSASTVTWSGSGSATLIGSFNLLSAGIGTTSNIIIPGSYAGTTARLVFSWKNDGSGGTEPPVAIDNISLTSAAPSPLNGNYSINNTLPTTTPMVHDGTGNFNNFTDAINYLNADGITVAVTFNVVAGQVFNENPPAITATGISGSTITFQKTSGTNPKITPTGSAGTADAGIIISGGDYITFDGIDIDASAVSAVEYGYLIRNVSATNGAQNNTIKNSKITLNRTNTSSRGIYQYVLTTPTNATGANSNNKFQAVTIENAYQGIYVTGNSTYPDLATEISNCVVGAATTNDIGNGSSTLNGIRLTSNSGANVFGNEVRNLTITSSSAIYGIYLESLQGVCNIYNNNVHDIKSTSTSTSSVVYGIRTDINSTFSCNVYNNFVSGLEHGIITASATQVIRGIAVGVSGTGTGNFYFNSVRIGEDQYPSSTAFYIGANGTINAKNNIFANFSTAGATSLRYCIFKLSSGSTLNGVNYNDYFINTTGTGNHVGSFNATNQNTLALWQTASGKDANSKNADPIFSSPTNLHVGSPDLDGAGVTIAIANGDALDITTDIDGATRGTPPDIGADEFVLAACLQPTSLIINNILYQSADISWTAPATITPIGYEWEVRTTNGNSLVASGSTTHPTVSASVSLLSGGTSYTLYVRTFCGGTDYSAWSSNTFSTLSCSVPTGVVISAIGTNSATLTWVAPVSGSPAGYEWEVRSSGLAGSGITGLAASGSTTSPTVTALASSLTTATPYSVYVRTKCYDGFFSAWTSAVTFSTACEAFPLPFSESFDGTTFTPNCWANVKTAGTGTPGIWDRQTAGTYPTCSPKSGVGMARYNMFNLSAGTKGILVTPAFNFPNDNYRLSFWMYRDDGYASNADIVNVYYNTSNNLTGTPVLLGTINRYRLSEPIANANGWYQYTFSMPVGVSGLSYLIFEAVSAYGNNVFLDDVLVEEKPACPAPSALNATSVQSSSAILGWTSTSASFEVEYGLSGFTQGEGTLVSPAANPQSISNLISNTTYQFYVRAFCDPVYSTWAGPFAFTTPCDVYIAPYSQDFEVIPPPCWLVSSTPASNNWGISSLASGYGVGASSAVCSFYSFSSGTLSNLFSPDVDATGLTNPILKFDYAYATYTSGELDQLNILVSSNYGVSFEPLLNMPGGFNGILNTAGNTSSSFVPTAAQWNTREILLPPGTNKVAFQGVSAFGNNLYIDNVAIREASVTSTWNGITNSQWYVATNWTSGVPAATTNVIIPGNLTNYPTLTALASCNNFTIQSGGSFIGSEFLTVNGTTTIERSITGYTSGTDGWHLISSPVANQTISGNWTPAGGYDFYALDESVSEYWLNQKNHPEMTNFIPGKGYLVAYETGETKSFTGAMNSAPLTMSGLTNSGGDYAGWHLVGNPFTSAINAALLTGTSMGTEVQVWNSGAASYEVSTTVPALNGFMVEVETTGNGELTIPLTSRVHSSVGWFKSTEDQILLRANDPAGHTSQLSIVRFNPAATEAYDGAFDSHYLAGFAPMFYSKSAGEGFALNTLPLLTNETVIPFDFVKNGSSDFSIEMLQAVPGAIIYLTDKKTNTITNLLENPVYSFNAVEGDITDRFLLTFGSVGIGNPDVSDINIYGYQDVIFVNGAKAGSDVVVTNLLGQVMMSTTTTGDGVNTINGRNLADGIYLVSIISGNSVVSKKVVLQK